MRRFIGLCVVLMVIWSTAAAVHAHSINGVDSITSGKVIQFGTATLTTGTVDIAHSLGGTPTCALFVASDAYTGSATAFRVTPTSGTVTVKAYDGNGLAVSASIDGYYFIGK